MIPESRLLKPDYPVAVVAGNVEHHQYQETICTGSGIDSNFNNCNAVHTHMTNTKMTDSEALDWHFPIRLESFSI